MTLKLELTPTVQSGLLAQAQAKGLSLEEYAEKVLKERSAEAVSPPVRKKSLLELFEPLRGLDIDFSRNPSTGRPVNL